MNQASAESALAARLRVPQRCLVIAALAVLPARVANAAEAEGGGLFHPLVSLLVNAGSGPREALALGLVAAALIIALAAMAVMVWSIRSAWSRGSKHRSRIRSLERELAEVKGAIEVEPQIVFRWQGAGDPEPVITGTLPEALGVPGGAEKLKDFSSWLERTSAAALDDAQTELRSLGKGFNLFATTQTGVRLSVEGFAGAGAANLRVRELQGSSLEAVIDAERHAVLEQELASLKAVLAKAPVLTWIRGREGKLRWVNEAYAEAVEAEDAGSAIADGLELIPPDARAKLQEEISRGTIARQRIHAVAQGERRAFNVIAVPSVLGDAGIAVDVTEADRLSDQLDRQVAAHARTLDQLATAVAIFGPDQQLNFYNAAYVGLWGLEENWLSQSPKDGEILDQLRDRGRLPEQADYRSWRQGRLSIYTALEAVEDWWHLPDGQSLRVVVVPHPLGGVTHLYENVTEQIALASRYNALFSVQRETLDNLHEGVALFGSDGRLKLSNPSFARIWNLDHTELENEPHMDAVIEACRKMTADNTHWNELRSSVSAFGGERESTSGRIERPNRSVVDYASVPLPDGATLFTYVDVTDSWRIEQALRERNEALLAADRLKTAFISHVSYELRAPLTNIIGFADLLATQSFGPINEKQGEYVGYIQRSSQKLHKLIDDILDLATIDAGVMELDSSNVDIDETLRATGALLSDRIENAGLTLDYDVPGDIGSVMADETRVKQILFNLLTNAIGFSPSGTAITIGARRTPEVVEIWVTDRGPGIAPEMRERVFERFETHTDGSSHRGSGLGLSVVKSFVELHGGTVGIESELGEGTTVRFSLPAVLSAQIGQEDEDGIATLAALDPAVPSH
ncbi:MAG: two-component sensor histidine kinase [Rhizobiales bacterium]|nr:two-component sensor histidine kinase [Hyphomicrobiales bacterium]